MAHPERHRTESIGWLRAAVLGANDGLISTSSLVVGVAAAQTERAPVLLAALASAAAYAIGATPLLLVIAVPLSALSLVVRGASLALLVGLGAPASRRGARRMRERAAYGVGGLIFGVATVGSERGFVLSAPRQLSRLCTSSRRADSLMSTPFPCG
jgi:VIT1/CCC1 family predicted Fe2+/Mn2+ transporter